MSSTPEWAAIERVVNDEVSRTERVIAKQRKGIIKRAVIAVLMLGVGVGVGTIGATAFAPDSDAVSQVTINKYIRANGGIPPCTYEDGSGQPGLCYGSTERFGPDGHPYVLVPDPIKGQPGNDKRVVWLDTHNDG
jgi:hypothetical protein